MEEQTKPVMSEQVSGTMVDQAIKEQIERMAHPKPVESLPKEEKMDLGEAYTKDGPVQSWAVIVREEGKAPQHRREYGKILSVPFKLYPPKWRHKHLESFCTVAGLIALIKADDKRMVPLLFEEAEAKTDKQLLKDLEHFGFLGTKTVQFFDKGKKMGGRKIIWLTPEGRGLEQDIIDRENAVAPQSDA